MKGFAPAFLNLSMLVSAPKCGHCHCQQEGVKVVDGINECCRQKIERVEADDSEEAYCKPGNVDLAFSADVFSAELRRQPEAEYEQDGNQQHHTDHLYDDGYV